ncbi:MAG: DNA polymerase III subunit alpha, partial [Helicobacter sp.]|nr:DNA polymerase III subunit alpha [Helicobacter sp.]
FDLIVKFAGYGFNKSHSAAYAMITYQTSYLKHHYPHEFMAALMTSEGNNTEQISKYIEEARHMNIRVLPPDINRSVNEFGVADEGNEKVILFGLGAIKGIGAAAVGVILDERANGEFENLEDFVSRIDAQKVNKKAFESLIKSGAMTRFGHSRRTLLQSIEEITETAREIRRAKEDQKSSLFCDDDEFVSVNLSLETLPEYEPKELLELEKESLGFYVSGHPLDDFKAAMEKIAYTKSSELEQIGEGSILLLVGKVEDIKIRFSKRGSRYGNVFLSDLHGTIELMAFDSTLKELESFGERLAHEPVCVKCKLQEQGERLQIMKVLELHDAVKEKSEIHYIQDEFEESAAPILLVLDDNSAEILQQLQAIAQSQSGNRELWILLRNDTHEIMIQTKMFVASSIQTQFPTLHWRHKSAIA